MQRAPFWEGKGKPQGWREAYTAQHVSCNLLIIPALAPAVTRSSSSDFPESTERAVRAERAHGRAAVAGPAGCAPPSPGATLQLSCSPVLSAPGARVLPKGWDGPRQRGVPETGGRSEEQPPKGHR